MESKTNNFLTFLDRGSEVDAMALIQTITITIEKTEYPCVMRQAVENHH